MEIREPPTKQQIKVFVSSEVASAFRQACDASHVSMAMVLSEHMAEYAAIPMTPKAANEPDYSTRRRRRAALKKMITELNRIRESEERSRNNIPKNLQCSEVGEKADEIISLLEEAIESLESAMVP